MKERILVKSLVVGVIVFFLVSSTSVVGISDIEDKSIRNTFIDADIQLTRVHIPILKMSSRGIKNSGNSEYVVLFNQLITMIESKGEVNSRDVENIVNNLEIDVIGVHYICRITADCDNGIGIPFPLTFLWTLFGPIFGFGGLLYWKTEIPNDGDNNEVTLGSYTYTGLHRGFACGYIGFGGFYRPRHDWQTPYLIINGFVLLAIVIPY